MSFDEFQNAWNNEKSVVTDLRVNEQTAMHSATILSRLRKNMRIEFFSQVGSYLLLLIIYIFLPKTPFSFMVVLGTSLVLSIQCFYYYGRFYRFYRETDRFDMSLGKHLRRVTASLELNIEIYKAFSICSAPVAVISGLFIFAGPFCSSLLRVLIVYGRWPSAFILLWLLPTILITGIMLIFFISLHARLQYGRYASELKQALMELED